MHPQKIVALDVEGVLIPEVWVNLARHTGIDALSRTTRDEPDYNVLMNYRLEILEREGVSMSQLREVLAAMGPLDGARAFLDDLRRCYPVVLLSDTFEQFAAPLMEQLGFPLILCHRLKIEDDQIIDYALRIDDHKRRSVVAYQGLNYQVIAAGDSYNDLSMIRAADAGCLFRAPDNVIAENTDLPSLSDYDELRAWIDTAI
jgi:phosphoserine/homoserine phosphotransferase